MKTNFSKELIASPGKKVKLSKWDPEDTLGWDKGHKAKASAEKETEKLDKLQYLLYAEHKRALLIVLQGMDAAGKDGTIRHVMAGVNPQGCVGNSLQETVHRGGRSTTFSGASTRPFRSTAILESSTALNMKMFWSCAFTNLVPKQVWSRRYDEINNFEAMLHENNVTILKFFLHISKDEQKRRFQQRIDDPDRRWKISEADFAERNFWDDYSPPMKTP